MEKADLTLNESWTVLGHNPDDIRRSLLVIEDIGQRVSMAEMLLEGAKRIAKRMQGELHPDKNPGDQSVQSRYIAVGKAIRSLEIHTQIMRSKYEQSKNVLSQKDRIVFK
jgi:hypothetical protein